MALTLSALPTYNGGCGPIFMVVVVGGKLTKATAYFSRWLGQIILMGNFLEKGMFSFSVN